jgi:hypothetical protein
MATIDLTVYNEILDGYLSPDNQNNNNESLFKLIVEKPDSNISVEHYKKLQKVYWKDLQDDYLDPSGYAVSPPDKYMSEEDYKPFGNDDFFWVKGGIPVSICWKLSFYEGLLAGENKRICWKLSSFKDKEEEANSEVLTNFLSQINDLLGKIKNKNFVPPAIDFTNWKPKTDKEATDFISFYVVFKLKNDLENHFKNNDDKKNGNKLTSFKWEKDESQLKKLFDLLKSSYGDGDKKTLIDPETKFEKFKKAFDGNSLDRPLKIKWTVQTKKKEPNKSVLFYLFQRLDEKNFIKYSEENNLKMLELIFYDKNGRKIENFLNSKLNIKPRSSKEIKSETITPDKKQVDTIIAQI